MLNNKCRLSVLMVAVLTVMSTAAYAQNLNSPVGTYGGAVSETTALNTTVYPGAAAPPVNETISVPDTAVSQMPPVITVDPVSPTVLPNGGWGGIAYDTGPIPEFHGPHSYETISTLDGRTIITNPPPIEGCNAGLRFYPFVGKYWCSSLIPPAGYEPVAVAPPPVAPPVVAVVAPPAPPAPPPPGGLPPPAFTVAAASGGGAPGTLSLTFGGNGSPLGYGVQVAAYNLNLSSSGGADSGSCLTSPGASGIAFVSCNTGFSGAYGFQANVDGASGTVTATGVPDGSGGLVSLNGSISGGGAVSGNYAHSVFSGTWQVVASPPGVYNTTFTGNRGASGSCSFGFADAGGGNFSLTGPCMLDSGGVFTATGMANADGTISIPFNDLPVAGFAGAFEGNWNMAGASGTFYSASMGTFAGGIDTSSNAPIVLDVYFNAGNAFIGTALATPNGGGYLLAGQSTAGLFNGSLNPLPSGLLGGGISINGGAYVAAVANNASAIFGTAEIAGTRYALGGIINGGVQLFAVNSGGNVATNGSIMAIADNDPMWVAFFAQQGQATDGVTLRGTFNSVLFDGTAYYPGTASGGAGSFTASFYNGNLPSISVSQP